MTWTLMFKCPACGLYISLTCKLKGAIDVGVECPRCRKKVKLNMETNKGEVAQTQGG